MKNSTTRWALLTGRTLLGHVDMSLAPSPQTLLKIQTGTYLVERVTYWLEANQSLTTPSGTQSEEHLVPLYLAPYGTLHLRKLD